MLRIAFVLSAAFFLLTGGLLYFLPVGGAAGLSVSPLWAARVAGAVLLAWSAQLFFAAAQPGAAQVGGLAVGNLLVAATLVPAALRGAAPLPPGAILGACGLLVLLALLALLAPLGRARS